MNTRLMKKLSAASLGLAIAASTLLSGCVSSGFNNSDLLRPPRTTGDKAEIQELIEQNAGGDYTLKYPKDGSYRSAIINEDLDGDSVDEAIVFYRPSTDDESTHLLFLKEINGEWEDVGDYSSPSSEVKKVEIGDITGDSKNEVIVGWTDKSESVCTLSVYTIGEKTTAEMTVDESCSQFLLADMTGEGRNSLMLFSLSMQNIDANAKMLQYDVQSKKMFTRSSVAMSNSANSFMDLKFGSISEEQSGVFVDTLSVSREGETQFIYWNEAESSLVNPLNTQNGAASSNPTFRASDDIVSTDINDDGIVELPILSRMPHTSNENIDLVAFLSEWNHYDPSSDEMTEVFEAVTNPEMGYYFIIPDEWKDIVTARYSLFGNSLTFYIWNEPQSNDDEDNNDEQPAEEATESEGGVGDKLLTIQVFAAEEWTRSQNSEFIEIGSYGDSVYAVNIPEDSSVTGEIAMSLNKIPEYFYLIN